MDRATPLNPVPTSPEAKYPFPESLINAVRDKNCVPFVGSGLSIPLNFPTWEDALKHLAEICKKEQRANAELILTLTQEGDYLDAAEKARKKLGEEIYSRELKKLFAKPITTDMLTNQRLVWDLGAQTVVTTNFDTLLEHSITPCPIVVLPQDKAKLAEVIRDTQQCKLLKLHGSISEFPSIVFSKRDYDRLYSPNENACQAAFKSLLLRKALLFIGFGLRDLAILNQLESTMVLFDGLGCTHYALLPYGEKETEPLWEKYHVHLIEYEDTQEIGSIIAALLRESRQITSSTDLFPKGRQNSITERLNESTGKIHIGISDAIPEAFPIIRHNSIDECIFLFGRPIPGAKVISLTKDYIVLETAHNFFDPRDELSEIRTVKLRQFHDRGNFPSPRFSLQDIYVEPIDCHSHGTIRINAQLTDWSLVDSIQDVMNDQNHAYFAVIQNKFWRSVSSLVGLRHYEKFPHHIGTHCLLISSDNRVILNKRINVSNQRERISASFEEQMQAACVYPPIKDKPHRFIDGDESPFDAIIRGAMEEFGIKLSYDQIRVMALSMESSSIAANFLAIAHSSLSISEIYAHWEIADDRAENLMVPPELSPTWSVEALAPILKSDTIHLQQPYFGRWHASSRARLLLGLIHDFGYDSVLANMTWGDFSMQKKPVLERSNRK
jgi:hypothetical protein